MITLSDLKHEVRFLKTFQGVNLKMPRGQLGVIYKSFFKWSGLRERKKMLDSFELLETFSSKLRSLGEVGEVPVFSVTLEISNLL